MGRPAWPTKRALSRPRAALNSACFFQCSQPERLGTVQPKPDDYDYELDDALAAVVGIKSIVPADAFTAETLGTERAGNGVLIRGDGLVLTIGYLDHRGRDGVDQPQRRTGRPGPRAGLRPGDRLRPRAGAGPPRPAGPVAGQLEGRGDRRARRRGRRRRPAALRGRAHHRQAGVRRLLGVCARRGDLHRRRRIPIGAARR